MAPLPPATSDPDVACIPVIHGFDIDLRAVVTPETSLSLRGLDGSPCDCPTAWWSLRIA